jgi:hypothetical protein
MTFAETYIYPPYKKTKTANKIRVFVNELRLFEYVRVKVLLYDDSTDELIETKIMTLEGCDYELWGNDDKYILEYVKNKLGQEGYN